LLKAPVFKGAQLQDPTANRLDLDSHVTDKSLDYRSALSADLTTRRIAEFCQKHSCYLIVDEAHATGIFGVQGRGLIDELCVEDLIFARVVTFGKAFGCHGAVVLGSNELINYLINFSRSFIYTSAMPIHSALTIKYALKELETTNQLTLLKIHKQLN